MKPSSNKTHHNQKKVLVKTIVFMALSFLYSHAFAQGPKYSADAFASATIINEMVGTSVSDEPVPILTITPEANGYSNLSGAVIAAFTVTGDHYSNSVTFSSSEIVLLRKGGSEKGVANSFSAVPVDNKSLIPDEQKYFIHVNIFIDKKVSGAYFAASPIDVTINYE